MLILLLCLFSSKYETSLVVGTPAPERIGSCDLLEDYSQALSVLRSCYGEYLELSNLSVYSTHFNFHLMLANHQRRQLNRQTEF